MKRREDLSYYLTMFVLTAPGAAIVWFVFHAVYENLQVTQKAVGYVDPMMESGILLGYCAMVGGTAALACVAVWAAIHSLRLLLKRSP